MLQALFFDIDGTLMDHDGAARSALRVLATSLPELETVEPAQLAARWHAADERHIARYLRGEIDFQEQRRERLRELLGRPLAAQQADLIFQDFLNAYESAWRLYDDVLGCLVAVAHIPLGIISNGDAQQQRQKLRRCGVARRFASVTISADCGYQKPQRAIFERACAALEVAPAAAMYVGDRLDGDARGAVAAGMQGVWLDRSGGGAAELSVIASLAELPALLQGYGT